MWDDAYTFSKQLHLKPHEDLTFGSRVKNRTFLADVFCTMRNILATHLLRASD